MSGRAHMLAQSPEGAHAAAHAAAVASFAAGFSPTSSLGVAGWGGLPSGGVPCYSMPLLNPQQQVPPFMCPRVCIFIMPPCFISCMPRNMSPVQHSCLPCYMPLDGTPHMPPCMPLYRPPCRRALYAPSYAPLLGPSQVPVT
jgi:hypothetical protein